MEVGHVFAVLLAVIFKSEPTTGKIGVQVHPTAKRRNEPIETMFEDGNLV
jgi:hypothetical protein